MDHLYYLCLVLLCFHAHLFVDALWSPAGKGLTSWLSFVMSIVTLSLSHWYPASGVVLVLAPDLCPLSYFQCKSLGILSICILLFSLKLK